MKDILVHLDDGARASVRLDLALGLAQRFGARLTGLFARLESHAPSAVAHRASDSLAAARYAVRDHFETALAAAGVDGRWWQLAHGEAGHVVAETGFCARYADLVILGQFEPGSHLVPEEMTETLVATCGRPVLVVPSAGRFTGLGEHAVVAWNASREAVRALNDAKPLLGISRQVTLLSLHVPHEDRGAVMAEVPPVDMVDHLARHGIVARLEHLAGEDVGKMDLLLSRLADLGGDLLVMGAHGQHGLSLGRSNATRYILKHMTAPVLISL